MNKAALESTETFSLQVISLVFFSSWFHPFIHFVFVSAEGQVYEAFKTKESPDETHDVS